MSWAEPSTETWALRAVAPGERAEVLREAVCTTHLSWDLRADGRDGQEVDALVRRHLRGDLELVTTRYGGGACRGRRARRQIATTDRDRYGLLLVTEGRERIVHAGQDVVLGAGDLLLWSGDRPITFAVPGPVAKTTLLVERGILDRAVPGVARLVGERIPAATGAAGILRSHLLAVGRQASAVGVGDAGAIGRATLQLAAAALRGALVADERAGAARLYDLVTTELRDHPAGHDLDVTALARRYAVSVRTLQRAFAGQGTTLTAWLREHRLEQCRQEILAARDEVTLTEIAFRWGFRDSSHFSRAYRRRFGRAPSADRRAG